MKSNNNIGGFCRGQNVQRTIRVMASAPTPLFAPAEVQPDNREPRPENVDGSFFVDHTCIGRLHIA